MTQPDQMQPQLPGTQPPETQPPDERVGYALVGIGELSSEELFPALARSRRSRLVALVTGNREKTLRLARQQGLSDADVYSYDDFEQLRDRSDVQAVFIVTPNARHRDLTERAAKIGKHVLCEKPMADTLEAAEAMVAACQAAGVLLMVAYRIQYTPHFQLARRLMDGGGEEGGLGRVKLMDSVNVQVEPDDGQWRLKRELAGGGSLLDVGLYCLNTTRFLTGEEPYEVFAYTASTAGDPRFGEVEESVSFVLRFPSGIVSSNLCSYGASHHRALNAYGADATLRIGPAFDYSDLRLKVETKASVTEPLIREVDQFVLELDHFSQCIQQGQRPFTPGEEGVQDQKIMAAIYESARSGRPVPLERITTRDTFRGAPPQQTPLLRP